ncbi:hypothetical protein FC093_00425 [Ilyomonas limi]|uniref:Uncharacterized protein n=1 Tax=Ilyomonas limi TaxID=2575867 RepID=A0A4U3LBV2_9BACT|nr:hypothetical protein [Ilyomonas limi]TKK71526.1 hypothetical protein FC093_00425 [Ilyomonas limi]
MQYWILDATTPANNLSAAITWLPYAITAVLLAAAVYLFMENKKLQARKKHYKSRANTLEIDLQQMAQKLSAMAMQKEKLEKDLADSELDRKALEDRLKSFETKKVQQPKPELKSMPVAAPAITEKATSKLPVQQPKLPVAKIKYARYADMGDGFSNAELLDKPDGETIFELTIAPNNNTGEYQVASHPDAQRYALSNAQYFLGKTCQYDSFPSGANAVIKTDTPGTVKLAGGKWTIVNPAKISFS